MHKAHSSAWGAGSTCCCMRDFLGYCLTWACCPLDNAVCCDDHEHCCPHNLPVCDVTAGRCLASAGQGFDGSVPWTTKQPANKVGSADGLRPVLFAPLCLPTL